MGWLADETGLEKCAANHVPLTPLSNLRWAAEIFPHREAVIDRSVRLNYAELMDRVTRLASALDKLGVKPGDVVEVEVEGIGTLRNGVADE